MLNLTVVILTFNEEKHIERCLRSVQGISQNIFVIDSFSTDRTVKIVKSLGARIWQHEFINYAAQFDWGLNNLPIETEWVMRLDADEYLEPELQQELVEKLPGASNDNAIDGIYLKRKHLFWGKWIRYGGRYPLILLRIWRVGKGRIEQRWMDEHIVLPVRSKTIIMKYDIVDDNQKGFTFWVTKHNNYASREMVDHLNNKYGILEKDEVIKEIDDSQAKRKRMIKDRVYSNLPTGFRAALYFLYRYFIQLGILDGGKGFIYHFSQGFWYRLLVDIKIMEVEKRCQGDIHKMRRIIAEEYGIRVE
jgi:glycosyltransferase involved in cell wall biosynthesis